MKKSLSLSFFAQLCLMFAIVFEIYGSPEGCKYCIDARNLCEKSGYSYIEYDVSSSRSANDKMRERLSYVFKRDIGTSRVTIPQIFLSSTVSNNSVYIGGFSELTAMKKNGELNWMIKYIQQQEKKSNKGSSALSGVKEQSYA